MLGSNMEISHANELNLLQQKIFHKAIRFSLRLTQKAIFVTREFIPSLYVSLHIALDLKKDEPIPAKFNRRGRKSKKRFIIFCVIHTQANSRTRAGDFAVHGKVNFTSLWNC